MVDLVVTRVWVADDRCSGSNLLSCLIAKGQNLDSFVVLHIGIRNRQGFCNKTLEVTTVKSNCRVCSVSSR